MMDALKKEIFMSSVLDEIRPFLVFHGEDVFYFIPAPEGGFSVTCQNVEGVNAQGDTFEDALECAVSMTAFVREVRADKETQRKGAPKGRPGTGRRAVRMSGEKSAKGVDGASKVKAHAYAIRKRRP